MSPSVEPVYDERSTAMLIMIIIICFLIALTVMFLHLWLESRSTIKLLKSENQEDKPTTPQLDKSTKEEELIIEQYKNLNDDEKLIIKQMLNSLNKNSQDKE